MHDIEAVNRALFLMLNATEGSAPALISFAKVIADTAIYLIPMLLMGLWFKGGRDGRDSALQALVVALVALGLAQIMVHLWPHPRPFAAGLGHAWIDHAADPSFPSDHVTVFASVAFVLMAGGMMVTGGSLLLLGLLVGWARIYLGVHFPLDIAGGIGVAALTLVVIRPVWSIAGPPILDLAEILYRKLFAWPIKAGWLEP